MIKTEQKNFTFASINSFVRNALELQLKEVKREQFRKDMAEASQDQLFLADVAQCQKDFQHVDKEEFGEKRSKWDAHVVQISFHR